MSLVRRLTTLAAATTLALVAIGGVVRATGSGDACPDWPRCFGRWVPPLSFPTLIEYSHRLLAAVATVLILGAAWAAWRRARGDGGILWPAVGAIGVVLVQSALGALRIQTGPKALVTSLHFLTAMALVAVVVVAATAARVARRPAALDPAVRGLTWWTVGVTAALLVVGAYVRGEQAGLVFLDWPLMNGRFIPDLSTEPSVASFLHRTLALGALVLGAALAWRARRAPRGVALLAWTAFALLVAQTAVGAAAVLSRLADPVQAAHVAGSSLAWAALVGLATVERRLVAPQPDAAPPRRRARERAAAYLQLTKPDIIVLLLITTVPAMVLADGGMPPWGLVVATLAGGALAAAGANAVNCYLDRDIDEVMARTRGRPLPSHRVEPGGALRFGIALVVTSFVWMVILVNFLAAALTVGAAAFYVFVYTGWLKRATPQNIVIGGAAGAVPVLVGWAAVTGTIEPPALVLFAIVFMWTPPHFWALALKYTGDYAAAGIPMLPVLRGREGTARQILVYSVVLVGTSLLLFPVAGMGPLYLAAAVGLGAALLRAAVRVWRHAAPRPAMAMFRFSITYLALLFVAVAADQLVRA
ncbi:MAG TPA: heme o synthase [Actinomycetota bacterium]|nr:heme o synthase [Actinomycetota bacterium]